MGRRWRRGLSLAGLKAGSGFIGTVSEDFFDGGFFGGGDPEFVFVFHWDLASDVGTAKLFVGGEPGGGVGVGFLFVGGTVDGEEI